MLEEASDDEEEDEGVSDDEEEAEEVVVTGLLLVSFCCFFGAVGCLAELTCSFLFMMAALPAIAKDDNRKDDKLKDHIKTEINQRR